jgi:hypothetical protein
MPSLPLPLPPSLPIHHGEQLSGTSTDDVDLRWNIISQKLKTASPPYKTAWIGKGHTGYASYHQLPINRGFDFHLGFLGGGQSYTSNDRWQNQMPNHTEEYSSDLFGAAAIDFLNAQDSSHPFFLYLPWQVRP